MKAIVTNKTITILDATPKYEQYITDILSFVDKSKQYQLRRMEKNPWQKNSPHYHKIKAESTGCLVVKQDNKIIIPSGFAYTLNNDMDIEDLRSSTGDKIALPWKKKPFDLRPYQQEAVELMDSEYRGLINMATGLGKTLTAIHAIRKIKRKTLIVCPGKSIADQFYLQLCEAFGSHRIGYMGGGKKQLKDITVGIVGTINNNIDTVSKHGLGLVIFDETHHISADTFFSIAENLGDIGKMFGLTATDFRSDGKDVMITAGVGPVVIKKDVVWGVQNGWLAEPHFFIRNIYSGQREFPGDKLKNYKSHILNCEVTKKQIENDCRNFINMGKSVLCLVSEVAHGEELSQALGVPFATGKDKKSASYIDELNSGKTLGLIGTDSFIGEGTDTKQVDVLILANFVASKGPVIQCLGRGLRKTNTKSKVIILDYKIANSKMLARHCDNRVKIYKTINSNITMI